MAEAISDPGDSDEHFDYHYVAKASLGIKDAPRGTGLETYLERNRSSDYDSKSYEDQQAEDKKISKEWEEKNDEDIDGNVIGLMAAGMFWPNDETSDAAMYALGARTTMSGSMKFDLDMGGDINWGVSGFNFIQSTGIEIRVGGDEDNWVQWAFRDSKILDTRNRIARMSAELYKMENVFARTVARTLDYGLFVTDAESNFFKQEFGTSIIT